MVLFRVCIFRNQKMHVSLILRCDFSNRGESNKDKRYGAQQFLDLEAELSDEGGSGGGANVSSDERDDIEGSFEASFVDDATQRVKQYLSFYKRPNIQEVLATASKLCLWQNFKRLWLIL